MRPTPFTRPTLLAAVELLERHTQASFDQLTLRLGFENEVSEGSGISVGKKVGQLGRVLVQRAANVIQTLEGTMTLGEAVVREALSLVILRLEDKKQTAFLRGLARDGYAVCNAQLRTFLESLFDALAAKIAPAKAAGLPTSENRRALLAQEGFLAVDRNEWSADGKNFINGLFKMLHTDGSHPGLSDEEHTTFRLHIVLVSARTFLRRYHNGN